jgi:predicted PurR-regulated permease PerM
VSTPRRLVVLRPQTVVLVLGLAAALVVLLLIVYAVRRVLIWALIALFIALALDHVVSLLQRRFSRPVATGLTYAALVAVLAGAGYLLVPALAAQVTELVDAAPQLVDKLSQDRGPVGSLARRLGLVERAESFVDQRGAAGTFGLGKPLVATVTAITTTLVALISIFFLSLFMVLQGPRWRSGVATHIPEDHRPLWQKIADGIHRAIGRWVIGAAVVAVVAGASASIVLFTLGVPYALALGLVVAMLDPIPFVGASAAAAIVSLAVLATNGLTTALIFLAFVLAYQIVFENHILVPLVYGRSVELSALSVLLAVLVGGELAGIIGALVAIPLLGSLKVVAGEVMEWRSQTLIVEAEDFATELSEATRRASALAEPTERVV